MEAASASSQCVCVCCHSTTEMVLGNFLLLVAAVAARGDSRQRPALLSTSARLQAANPVPVAACGVSLSRSSGCLGFQRRHKKPMGCCFTFFLVDLCVIGVCLFPGMLHLLIW